MVFPGEMVSNGAVWPGSSNAFSGRDVFNICTVDSGFYQLKHFHYMEPDSFAYLSPWKIP